MKIAALTISYPNLSEQFVVREFDGLAARGHEVVVFTARPPAGPLYPATALDVREWTDTALRQFAPDVLYASLGIPAHRRTIEAARIMGVPYALRCWQGYDMFCNPSPELYGAAVRDPLCLAVVVEDDFAKHYASVEMEVAAKVIPNGIDTTAFAPHAEQPPHEKIRVLNISRWVAKKGLRHLCAAWRALRPDNAELVLIGYGPLEEELRAHAGLNTGVTFLPPIPPGQLPDAYQAADIFAAPCISPKGGDADGVPTTVLEAMACGLPVIASDLHSLPLYVEHERSGLLTAPGDESAIAAALDRLITDHPLRQRLGAQARRAAVERFSLSASLDKLEAILCA